MGFEKFKKEMANNLERKQAVECLECNARAPHVHYIPSKNDDRTRFELICRNCGAEGMAEWNGLDFVNHYGNFQYNNPRYK